MTMYLRSGQSIGSGGCSLVPTVARPKCGASGTDSLIIWTGVIEVCFLNGWLWRGRWRLRIFALGGIGQLFAELGQLTFGRHYFDSLSRVPARYCDASVTKVSLHPAWRNLYKISSTAFE